MIYMSSLCEKERRESSTVHDVSPPSSDLGMYLIRLRQKQIQTSENFENLK